MVVHSWFTQYSDFFKVTHFLKICESKNLCRQFCRHPTFFCYSFLGQSVVVKRCDIFLVQSQDKLLLSSYVQQSYIYVLGTSSSSYGHRDDIIIIISLHIRVYLNLNFYSRLFEFFRASIGCSLLGVWDFLDFLTIFAIDMHGRPTIFKSNF